MANVHRHVTAFVLCVMVAGCAVPRGAGFQTEVLAATKTTGEDPLDGTRVVTPSDFSVHVVTRDSLSLLSTWPTSGKEKSYSWIGRQAQTPSMIIAAGDMLDITVYDTEENSLLGAKGQGAAQLLNVPVSATGTVFLPFVGEMKLSGMTPAAARAAVEERFSTSIPSAQVQLFVKQGRANTANLVAGVTKPGPYPLPDRDFTLLGLLAAGGGVQPDLENPQVRLLRGGAVYGIALSRLYEDPSLDTTLRGGDRVVVEEDKRYFLSLGAASEQAIHPFTKEDISALDAVSIIGGLDANRANPQGILLLREYPSGAVRGDASGPPQERMIFVIDLTTADGLFSAGKFKVMDGDLVYATESAVTSTRTVLGLIGTVFGIANQTR